MSRNTIYVLIYHRHKPLDHIYVSTIRLVLVSETEPLLNIQQSLQLRLVRVMLNL
jgi:hypothetical protein